MCNMLAKDTWRGCTLIVAYNVHKLNNHAAIVATCSPVPDFSDSPGVSEYNDILVSPMVYL